MQARPFVKPAISEHIDQYMQVITDTLNSE